MGGGGGTGLTAAISGPGRGYAIDTDGPGFVLAGDETAIPAISQLLEAMPATSPVQVLIEVADAAARLPLPEHAGATVEWTVLPHGAPPGDALDSALRGSELPPGTLVWAAGEAASMPRRIRRHLFDDRGLTRAEATVRGYWKHGRSGDADADT